MFVGVGGGRPKNAPTMERKVTKWLPHGEKAPHNEKNVAKRLPYKENGIKNEKSIVLTELIKY